MTVALVHDVVSGPPNADIVLFLGSLGSDRSMWSAQVTGISDMATVITADVRGHGGTAVGDGPVTVHDLSEDVIALLDALAIDRVHLVGLSLGGAIAQTIAAHHPERVHTLTVLCSAAKFGDPTNWTSRAETVRRDGLASIAQSIVGRWFTTDYAADHPNVVARAVDMVSAVNDEGYARCCEALASYDSRPFLDRIVAPTLVIAGDCDLATPREVMAVIADGVTNARMHVLSPAAHLAATERAEEVTTLIRDHVGRPE
ncbi:alpha/beta fold hydrolase [Rhodococcus sp. NBC_00294]|uniref:alpha/beta fold hydrolase n=1 Tax=Rhodococcus sp. NBC_00294 TaxID=2976004 RepID=UPI002E29BF86|nr:alpha/beta fold hydrolase [Rhodococcus sp. NBC_00294]